MAHPPSTTDEARADELRAAMVDRIAAQHERLGLLLDADVRRALLTVPRHLFAEDDADLEAAYKDQNAIVTKRNDRGLALSSLSAPWLQALMIRQAAVQPGHASWKSAAAATTPQLSPKSSAQRPRRHRRHRPRGHRPGHPLLTAAGYRDVEVVTADAEYALRPAQTFDAIIVTVGAWDVPPAWSSQLGRGGRSSSRCAQRHHPLLGLEHRSRPGQRRPADVRLRAHAGSRRVPPGLVPLLPDDMVRIWQDEDDDADLGELTGALSQPRAEAWSGVAIGSMVSFADLDLWLATTMPGSCLITARQQAIDDGTVSLSWPHGTPALADGPTSPTAPSPAPWMARNTCTSSE